MSPEQINILGIGVTAFSIIVTIVGFIITYYFTKHSLKDEIQKSKTSIALEKMEELPYELVSLFEKLKKGTLDVDGYSSLLGKIYSYCSPTAITITVKMQYLIYENDKKGNSVTEKEKFRILTLLSLMISQIKYDLTGETINPELWFIMKIKDYKESPMKKTIQELINHDVAILDLNEDFMCQNIDFDD